ncbi:ATP-binding protein [Allokutzneria albata]|uniref:AAA ATPase domain-containing protein n=1 Tax=Allokutzneria albata TaxID=211114 RepID=A0A1G9W992_ALLAB|nr:AAA family ATPase [Allokutzneria albata]SDM80847.1 AAA ATPase domain-containing protein [Allokutzneria albata]
MGDLIGRDRPLAVLLAESRKALSGRGGACFVTGEAGIGKTALVSAVVGSARAAGAAVVVGACWESEEAPDCWPWLQVVRELRPQHRFAQSGFEFYAALRDNVFRLVGEVWTLTFAERSVQVPDSKGLRDLHALLSNPGADISASWLLNPDAPKALGADDVLDDEAKARYRQRLDELESRIDEEPDARKAARLDAERQALLDELRAAAGLGGRTRRLGDTAERARKAVGNRVRDALRRLDDRHPALAAHLRGAVATGSTCRYDPAPGVTWRL